MNELDTLKDALKWAKNSVVPGAITNDGKCLVQYDEEQDKYIYTPDLDHKGGDRWTLDYEQLDRLVLFATQKCWIPASNFVTI